MIEDFTHADHCGDTIKMYSQAVSPLAVVCNQDESEACVYLNVAAEERLLEWLEQRKRERSGL